MIFLQIMRGRRGNSYSRTASHSNSRSRGRGEQSPPSSTIDNFSPKHTKWYHQTFDDYDNDTRYTEDTFDCRDSQLSLSIPRVNTEATGLTGYTDYTGYTGYSDQTGLTDRTGLSAASGYTGDYTADTFWSNAEPAKRRTNASALIDAAPPSPRRVGFTNESVVLNVPAIDAVKNGDNTTATSKSIPNHPMDVLEVQSQFIEHKSRDELKPFAIVEVEVRSEEM